MRHTLSTMAKSAVTSLGLVAALFAFAPSYADIPLVRPTGDGTWYFSVGGADPYVNYRQSNRTTVDLEVGVEWNMFRNCQFDPRINIVNTFKDAQHSLYGLANDVVAAAPGMLQAWGLSKVQENYPGVYDFMTKGLVDAKFSFQGAVKSCRDLQNDLGNGRNPMDGWLRVSKNSTWADAARVGDNPVFTDDDMETKAADRGVMMPGGVMKGGRNANGTLQPPILTVADTVEAGYSHVTLGASTAEGGNGVTGDERITRVFKDSDAATKWTTSVVGERMISTCTNCTKLKTKVGQGLRLTHSDEKKIAEADLLTALTASKITNAMLTKLSSPGMGIMATDQVIRSLREAPPAEQAILANRFTSELAMSRTMEKALIARDLLNAGEQDPNLAANQQAQEEITYAKQRLQREIDNVLFEQDVKSRVLTNSSRLLSERMEGRDLSSQGKSLETPRTREDKFKDGGVAPP